MSDNYKSCYCSNARRCSNMLKEYYDGVFKRFELTGAQYYLLVNLRALESANITQWSEFVGLERSTMVRNVAVLEKRGLILTVKGRGKVFKLSEHGEEILEMAEPVWKEAQQKMEEYLGAEDAAALLRISAKLSELRMAEVF